MKLIDNIVKIDKMDSAINKKVSFLLIYFYRLTDTIDINQKVIIDNYRFIDWFSDIGFLAGIKCFSKNWTL